MSSLRTCRGVAALIALSLPVAACGSSNSSSTGGGRGSTVPDPATASANYNRSLKLASCMRTHGVPNFPDPKSTGGGGMQVLRSPSGTQVNGVSVNGPAFQSALQACKSDLPNGGKPRPIDAARRNQILAFSRCMRAHGITNFPDPKFSSTGGAQLLIGQSSGINPNAPAFQAAQKACGAPLGGKVAAAP